MVCGGAAEKGNSLKQKQKKEFEIVGGVRSWYEDTEKRFSEGP